MSLARLAMAALTMAALAGCARTVPATETPPATATAAPVQTATPGTVPQPSAAPSPTSLPTAIPTPAPPKLPIVIALDREPETLHPFYARSMAAQTVSAAWHLGCVSYDSHPLNAAAFFKPRTVALGCEPPGPPALIGEPGSPDAHYMARFVIRPDWFWTDGTPVTAQDAIFAWKFIMHPDAQIRDSLTQKVFRVMAVDQKTVDVHFMSAAQARQAAEGKLRGDVPFEYFSQLNDYEIYARQAEPLMDDDYALVLRWLPAHSMKGVPVRDHIKPAVIAPALRGDGPFALGAWNAGREIVLNRKTKSADNAESIIFRFVPNPAAAVDRSQANIGTPTAVITGSGTQAMGPTLHYAMMNISRPLLADETMRSALASAMDSAKIAATLALTRPWPMDGVDSINDPSAMLNRLGWDCKPVCERFVPAVRGVRNAFTETLRITLTVAADDDTGKAIAALAQANLMRAGLTTLIQVSDPATILASAKAGGLLANRNWDVLITTAALPLIGSSAPKAMFACTGAPPKPAPQNASGFCPEHPGDLEVWATAVQKRALVPLGAPLLRVPVRGVTGLDYGGYGPITWNAWAWKN